MAKKLLIKGKAEPDFPAILLSGGIREKKEGSSLIGYSSVEFRSSDVSVMTVNTYETTEIDATVNICVYEGYPDDSDISNGKISVSGYIEVGKKNIRIHADDSGQFIIPWPAGETGVIVVLNCDEVMNGEIRNVTFFLEYEGKNKFPSGEPKFIRSDDHETIERKSFLRRIIPF